jgi:hypothetical protein
MSIVERDYILRAIEELGQAIARVVALVADQKLDLALSAIDEAERALLGLDLGKLETADATTVSLLLHNPDRVRGWARLLAERASVLGMRGDAEPARRVARRSRALYAAAERRGAALSATDREAVERMAALDGG